jgi:hypothetical protein
MRFFIDCKRKNKNGKRKYEQGEIKARTEDGKT